jgi:hypothetical protein
MRPHFFHASEQETNEMLELSPSRPGVSERTRLRVVSWSGPIIGGIVLAVVAATATGAGAAPATPPSVASGTLAALNGSSIEVQNPTSGQVTVSWTPSTTFSQVQTVSSSTLAVGDCVSATGAAPKTKTKSKTAAFTATTVSISHPGTNGTCSAVGGFGGAAAGGLGGGGGFAGRGFAGRGGSSGSGSGSFKPPSGTFPGGGTARRAAGAFGGVAFGKVTSVSGSVITVAGERFAPTTTKGTKSSSKTSKKTPPKPVKTTSKVTFTSSTAFTQTVTASSSALAVGLCVTALGPAGDTGAITASTISLRPAPSSGCVSFSGAAGFGRFGRGGGAGGTSA